MASYGAQDFPASDETLTIAPRRRSTICGNHLDEPDGRAKVRADHSVNLIEGRVLQAFGDLDTSVVHKDIDRTELTFRRLDELAQVFA